MTHCENTIFKKQKAFTLAEVLITLGVIGVVAGMTIPGLISAYQKHVAETRLKAVYSTILQGFRMYQAQYGDFSLSDSAVYDDADVSGYSYKKSKDVFEKFFAPVFVGATAYPKGTKFDFYSSDGSTELGVSVFNNYGLYYALANGTVLGFAKEGNTDGIVIQLILNPNKLRLKAGRDYFQMFFQPDASGTYRYRSLASVHYNNQTRSKFIENCKSNISHPQYSSYGVDFCTVLIIKNSFKIPSDYPVKF